MMWMASILQVLALGATEPAAPLAAPAPPPIFWKQTLFSIPFQVQRAATAAQEPAQIQLFVSPDRGLRWDNWRQARPQEGHFLFRAGVDGEYWFDVRTVDRSGQTRPQGPHSPQLVVVVDTTPPKVQLAARRNDAGRITASFNIEELYLRSDSLTIDFRLAPTAQWQAVAIRPIDIHSSNAIHTGDVSWQSPTVAGTMEIRLRVHDLAGNSAESQTQVVLSTSTAGAYPAGVGAGNAAPNYPRPNPFAAATPTAPSMSVSSSAASQPFDMARPGTWQPPSGPPAQTPWPAENGGAVDIRVNSPATNQLITVRDPAAKGTTSEAPPPGSAFSAFQASPNASGTRSVPDTLSPPAGPPPPLSGFTAGFTPGITSGRPATPPAPAAAENVGPPPGESVRWINSRAFQLTYDTLALGGSNVPIRLWGTRDGGMTWQSFGADSKGQSPMLVTVPEEGIYGFDMLLQNGNRAGQPPLPGEKPRTWIGVDLTRPVGRITQARQGAGRDADKLFISWEASDNRALADKPISLSFSESAGGPWTSIVADAANAGQYAWPLHARLPQRVYLRLEIRDAAGNIGVFEMPQPVALELCSPSVPLGDLRPLSWIDGQSVGPRYLR